MVNSPLHKTDEIINLLREYGYEYIFIDHSSAFMNPVVNVFDYWEMRCERDFI